MVKNLPASAGDTRDVGSIPGSGRSSGEEYCKPFQYCLGNPMDRGAWWTTVYGAARSWTRLSTRHNFDLIGRGETSWVHSFAHIAPLGGHEQRTDLQGTYTRCALYTDKGGCLHSNAHACTKKTLEGCLSKKIFSVFFLLGRGTQAREDFSLLFFLYFEFFM